MEKALFEFSAGRVIQPVRNLFAVEEGIAAASQVIVGKTMSGCSHFTIALF